MRILQIIDSLEVGGAEKMSVNYANALAKEITFSGLVVTRKGGALKNQINSSVNYFFLNKRSAIDVGAIFRLKAYCKKNQVEFVHAHSTSYFTAFLLKLIYPNIKIIWHDHYGLSEFLSTRKSFFLKMASLFFQGIIVVNYQLKSWAEKELKCKNILYLPNFTHFDNQEVEHTKLLGEPGKRILNLANLRLQKNHFLLIDVAERLQKTHPDWTFHLVGKDFNDGYSEKIRKTIEEKNINNIFIYGATTDIGNVINSSDIAILTSQSEGLPVAVLEYGLFKKAVVSTNVGEIPFVINDGKNGYLVPNYDVEIFYEKLVQLIEDEKLRAGFGESLYNTILEKHSEEAIMKIYLDWIKKL